jgi:hypothetical protein
LVRLLRSYLFIAGGEEGEEEGEFCFTWTEVCFLGEVDFDFTRWALKGSAGGEKKLTLVLVLPSPVSGE